MNMYKYISRTWRTVRTSPEYKRYMTLKRVEWRKGKTIKRMEKPTRLDKAHAAGYKAKQGYAVVRVKVRKGGLSKIPPKLGRRQKRMGISKIKRGKSAREIAEERAKKKFRNLSVIGSYYLGEDGEYIWYEIIMRDENHPSIRKD